MTKSLTSEAQIPQARRKVVGRPLLVVLLIGFALLGFYGGWIEPNRIEVTRYEVRAPVAAPIKIAHLSDLHTRGLGRRERRLLAILEAEKPDLIVVTGDTLAGWSGGYAKCREVYEKLHAPLGVWFVRGNWENWKPLRHERAFYDAAGVHLLANANASVAPNVWLVGLDDPYTGTARLDVALQGVPTDAFKIALFHSPAFFDRAAGRVNLCLVGHTHGGQVRIPFIRPFWLPSGCGRFLEGWYEERGSQMYVSRGLGMSILPVRFLCRPEVSFITLEP